MSKKVLVTGGCGYIGSHVARAVKKQDPDNQVFIIDRVKRDHTLLDCDGYFIDDFASDSSLATIVDLAPDAIVHCAGTSLVGPSMTDPAEYYVNNISKTIRLLNVVKDLPKKPVIVFSSSASVYGIPGSLPIHETDPIQPISPYGQTKAMTEQILHDYFKAYQLSSVCLRYFNAAGAEPFEHDLGQEPGATHIVARVLEAHFNNEIFTLNGDDFNTPDNTCIRDYVHVWDLARAHVMAIDYVLHGLQENINSALKFNLGTNKGISNKQIVDYVAQQYGLVGWEISARRPGDPDELVADATNANRVLGWIPQHSSIESIIDTAYKWYSRKNV